MFCPGPSLGDVLATTIRKPPSNLVGSPSPILLPRTAADLRQQRARASLAAVLPLLLFAVTVLPRVWESDLVPFGGAQATALTDAGRTAGEFSPAEIPAGRGDRALFRLLYPITELLPSPLEVWIALRAVLDGGAAILLYLAVRALAGGTGGAVAGLVYAASPWAWLLSRDPAVTAPPLLVAGVLYLATRVARTSSPLVSGLLGLGGGLLAAVEPLGWLFVPAVVSTLALARPGMVSMVAACAGMVLGAGLSASAWVAFGRTAGTGAAGMVTAMPFGGTDVLWHLVAGLSLESRLTGIAELPALFQPLAIVPLVCSAALMVLGVWRSLELARAGSGAALVPGLWLIAALVVMLLHGRRRDVEELHALLPAVAALAGLACSAAGRGQWPRRLSLALACVLAGCGAATVGALAWSATTLAQSPAAMPYADWAARRASADGRAAASIPEWATERVPRATYRFWASVAAEARGALERTGTSELNVIGSVGIWDDAAPILASLVGGPVSVRSLPSGALILPTAHEAAYVVLPGAAAPGELDWPSARLGTIVLAPTDAAAHVLTLRPRPLAHWSALHARGSGARFEDGSMLLATRVRKASSGTASNASTVLELLWLSPRRPATARPSQADAATVMLATRRDGHPEIETRAILPPPPSTGESEVVVQRVDLLGGIPTGSTMTLRLLAPSGVLVRGISGPVDATGAVEIVRPK